MSDTANSRRRMIADIVGGDEEEVPVKRPRGRPRKDGLPPGSVPPEKARRSGRRVVINSTTARLIENSGNVSDSDDMPIVAVSPDELSRFLVYGIDVNKLARIFGLPRATVERRLKDCRPIEMGKYNAPLYGLAEAASYLVEPRVDIGEYIKNVKADKLPDHLRETVWSARLKQQRYEEKAGDLWRTEKVMSVVGELLLDIGSKLNLIPDQIERRTGLNSDQYSLVRTIVDSVREEIYDQIETLKLGKFVSSQLGEMEEDD